MPYVITLTGPSRAGKSTTVSSLLEFADESVGFKPKLIPKYTTRPRRDDDRGETIYVESIPTQCDLVYELYGYRYGFELKTLFDLVAEGCSPVVILNDVRAVEDVRHSFREMVRSIFIFRESPSSEEYRKELEKSRGKEAAKLRFRKAQTIYRIYTENIYLFDHVIINTGTEEDLKVQVKQIVLGLSRQRNQSLVDRE